MLKRMVLKSINFQVFLSSTIASNLSGEGELLHLIIDRFGESV